MQLHILESYCRFDEPKCITLHFATFNDICQSSDHLIRLLMSSCNCEHSDWLRTLPETLVSSANLRMEFSVLLFTKRLGNVSATCNVSVSVSSRTHNVSSRSRLGHSSRRLGLGRKGLVQIPATTHTRAYSKRVFRTNCALRIKKCAPRNSSGIYFFKHKL